MSHLRELKPKRLKILEAILNNQVLCKLIAYDGDETHPLERPDIQDTTSLVGQRIFVTPFIPIALSEQCNTLNVFFDKIKNDGTKFKDIEIKFLINCHYANWELDGDLRPDLIVDEIEDLLNFKSGFGIGKVLFKNRILIPFANDFAGYELTYVVSEWN